MHRNRKHLKRRTARTLVLLVAWFCVIACGFAYLANYSNTPCDLGEPPQVFSKEILGRLFEGETREGSYYLVMGIHPHCPCTRATLGELNELIAKCRGKLTCSILVFHPSEEDSSWYQTDLWSTAQAMPDTGVVPDVDGRLCRELNLLTSGGVVLCDAHGNRLFYGGITASRGHQGDNLGSDAILSCIRTGRADRDHTKVFGCALNSFNDEDDSALQPGGAS